VACNEYDLSLTVLHPTGSLVIDPIPVVECQTLSGSFQCLLGRDLLAHCLFVYDGPSGTFTLAF
jgi:hypothetical protein